MLLWMCCCRLLRQVSPTASHTWRTIWCREVGEGVFRRGLAAGSGTAVGEVWVGADWVWAIRLDPATAAAVGAFSTWAMSSTLVGASPT